MEFYWAGLFHVRMLSASLKKDFLVASRRRFHGTGNGGKMELTLITLFILKHTIADYFTQYSWMIKDKGTYGAWGGLAHAGWHGLLTFSILVYVPIVFQYAVLCALADMIIHYHVDYVKSNFWKSKNLTPMDQQYWIAHGVDQLLHLLTYVGIIYVCVSNLM